MYRRNRYYDPQTGRFTTPDPIGVGGGLNAYGFAGGDPVSYRDPFGLCPPCDNWTPAEEDYEIRMAHEGAKHPGLAFAAATIMVGATVGLGSDLGLAILARLLPAGATAAPAAPRVEDMMEEVGTSAGAAVSKIPFDGFQEWGRTAVGWGRGAAGAARAMADMSVEKAAAIDPQKVQAAKVFYENAVASGKGSTAAPVRVQLMQRILDLQKN